MTAIGEAFRKVAWAFSGLGSAVTEAITQDYAIAEARLRLAADDSSADLEALIGRARASARCTPVTFAVALAREVARETGEDRAALAGSRGWHDLAQVIRAKPGRQFVREGLHDVRVWLGEVEPDRTPAEEAQAHMARLAQQAAARFEAQA